VHGWWATHAANVQGGDQGKAELEKTFKDQILPLGVASIFVGLLVAGYGVLGLTKYGVLAPETTADEVKLWINVAFGGVYVVAGIVILMKNMIAVNVSLNLSILHVAIGAYYLNLWFGLLPLLVVLQAFRVRRQWKALRAARAT